MPLPVLYSFRRCPYAMRARLAISSSGVQCALREIVLRDKAPEFLETSPKGTVPVLVTDTGQVIEQSLDIMLWALGRSDPEGWLAPEQGSSNDIARLISRADDDFKTDLDRYKYASRYVGAEPFLARADASFFLQDLNAMLAANSFLSGARASLADFAIAPFVRQFANVDRDWFDAQDWPHLLDWLNRFLASDRFSSIMTKYPMWRLGDPVTLFPKDNDDAS